MKNDTRTELTPKKPGINKTENKTYNGGFHIQPTKKPKNGGASKRSSTQTFTFG